jgi:hypothetical protein
MDQRNRTTNNRDICPPYSRRESHANPINNFQRILNEWDFESSLSNRVLTFWHRKGWYVQGSKDQRHKLTLNKSGLQTGLRKTVSGVELAKAHETIVRQANEITQQANKIRQLEKQLEYQANILTNYSTRGPTGKNNQQNGNPEFKKESRE